MKAVFTFFLFVFTFTGFAQTAGLQWRHSLGGAQNDFAEFSFRVEGTNFILVGRQTANNGDIVIRKFSGTGTLLWNLLVGGNDADQAIAYVANPDGSFVIAANTLSTSGGITGNHGGYDVLVFKVSAGGQILWQKCLGGSQGDVARAITKNSAGEYLLVNSTRSNDGNVTGYRGDRDVWMVKLNDAGTIVWQKCFGGSLTDIVNGASIIQAADNSFWIATETTSTDGNITANNGQTDIWLLNINEAGNLLTQRTLGGAGNDYAAGLRQTADGKLYVLGQTRSVNLPNYHNYGSVYNNNGDYSDNFLVCLNPDGTTVWQKCFGGNLDDTPVAIVTDGGGVVIASQINAGGGDVTSAKGWTDMWVAKITSPGSIVWQNTLGGSYDDGFAGGSSPFDFSGSTGGMLRSTDGGFLLSGYTTSNDGDVSGYHPGLPGDSSQTDLWIVKLNGAGAVSWTRTLGGTRGEWVRGNVVELSPTEMIVTAHSNSTNYDVPANSGGADIWVAKLGSVNTLKGTAYFDANGNGTKDAGEAWANGVFVTAQKPNDSRTALTGNNGYFVTDADTGSYTVTAVSPSPYYIVSPLSFVKTFTTYFNEDSLSFALQPIPNKADLAISLIPVTPARPGFATAYRIFYKNAGTTTIPSGEILFKQDSRLAFAGATPVNTGTGSDTLKWTYSNLAPGDTASILLQFTVGAPPAVNVGDTLRSAAWINPQAADETPADNTSVLIQRVVGSYDPNDKAENNGGWLKPEQISNGSYLHYIIRFQNTGTDIAYTVVVRDTLEAKVDLRTLEIIGASHPYKLAVTDGNKLVWTFNNINLPYGAANEPGSHGYIVYRIRPKTTLVPGDTVHNTASIYFDYNLPVLTNDAYAKVQSAVVLPLKLLSFTGVYTGAAARLGWTIQEEAGLKNYAVERSVDGINFVPVGGVVASPPSILVNNYTYTDDLRKVRGAVFYYRFKMVYENGRFDYSSVILIKVTEASVVMQLMPNPARNVIPATILSAPAAVEGRLQVLDNAGRPVWQKACRLAKGKNTVLLNGLTRLPTGTYRVRFTAGEYAVSETLLIAK